MSPAEVLEEIEDALIIVDEHLKTCGPGQELAAFWQAKATLLAAWGPASKAAKAQRFDDSLGDLSQKIADKIQAGLDQEKTDGASS